MPQKKSRIEKMQDRDSRIIELHSKGYSAVEIAREVHLSRATVYIIAGRYGLDFGGKGAKMASPYLQELSERIARIESKLEALEVLNTQILKALIGDQSSPKKKSTIKK